MTTVEELYDIFLRHPIITTDSRCCERGAIFFALKGDSFDGNRFADVALAQGCSYAVVDEEEFVRLGDARYILVEDVLTALQELAHYHREHFAGVVLQITGTNGKTTTKELVSAVLKRKYKVLCTEGNFNNHIGVPKTLLLLAADDEIAVIETGANHVGEIKVLADIVNPDCGLITNVGVAHIEGFGSFEGVVKTKGELYDKLRNKKDGFIFLNADNEHLCGMANGLRALKYGEPGRGYDVEGNVVECAPFVRLRWRRGDVEGYNTWHEVTTKIVGSYNITNVLAAICVGVHFGVEDSDIDAALSDYEPKNNRSEMRTTPYNTLVVDAYNANPSSMRAALDNFHDIVAPEGLSKMLILGDMKELGNISIKEHQALVDILDQYGFKDVWLVGANFAQLNSGYRAFNDVDEVKDYLRKSPLKGRMILIKGSNSTHLYQLPDFL